MSRLVTACILISSIIVCSILGLIYVKNKKDECSHILHSAYSAAKSGNIKGAEAKAKEFNDTWGKAEKYLMIFLHRQDLDEITFTSRIILEYIKSEEMPEFYAELKKVMALLDHTFETEMPLFENIL